MRRMEDEFEGMLRERLKRQDAPASLADAVMSRIDREPRRLPIYSMGRFWIERLAAVVLLTVLLAGVGVEGIHHRRAAERARAESDFARSQELTSRALEPVRQHLRQAGIALDQ